MKSNVCFLILFAVALTLGSGDVLAGKTDSQVLAEFEDFCEKYREDAEKSGMVFQAAASTHILKASAQERPAIGGWSWYPNPTPGKKTTIWIRLYKADERYWHSVNLSVYFGPVGYINSPSEAILARRTNWPMLSQRQEFPAAMDRITYKFEFEIPEDADKGTYYLNMHLWRYAEFWDKNFTHYTIK